MNCPVANLLAAYSLADRLAAWHVDMLLRTNIAKPGSWKSQIAAEDAFRRHFFLDLP